MRAFSTGLVLLLLGCTPSFDRPRPGGPEASVGPEARVDRAAADLAPDLVPEPDIRLCGPALCAGCCAADGVCQPGNTTSACGHGGADCVSCSGSCSSSGVCSTCQPSCAGKPCGLSSDGCGGTCLAGSGCKLCGPTQSCPWTYSCASGNCLYCQPPDFKLVGSVCLPSCKPLLVHKGKLESPWKNECCQTKCVDGVEVEEGPDKTYDCFYCCSTKTQEIKVLCK
jgi:hypothetical protein